MIDKYFQEMVDKVISKYMNQLSEKLKLNVELERLLDRNEAAEFLKVSLPTLNRWSKSGKIKSYHFPGTGRVFYKQSELLDSLEEYK